MKRIILATLLTIAFLAASITSTVASSPGCQSMCLDYSANFIQQCYIATGDSVACTQAGSYLYEQCVLDNCPGRPPR